MSQTIHNASSLVTVRKELRHKLTVAEAVLWRCLKQSQLDGRKFRRQHSVGLYILDFYCPTEKLCVELDGAHHFTIPGQEYDTMRTEYLNTLGIKVIRFENQVVFDYLENVLEAIKNNFNKQ